MAPRETTLEMVARHVREGREHIAQQRLIIEELRALGLPTKEAEDLLAQFLEIQRGHEEHFERLKKEQGGR